MYVLRSSSSIKTIEIELYSYRPETARVELYQNITESHCLRYISGNIQFDSQIYFKPNMSTCIVGSRRNFSPLGVVCHANRQFYDIRKIIKLIQIITKSFLLR